MSAMIRSLAAQGHDLPPGKLTSMAEKEQRETQSCPSSAKDDDESTRCFAKDGFVPLFITTPIPETAVPDANPQNAADIFMARLTRAAIDNEEAFFALDSADFEEIWQSIHADELPMFYKDKNGQSIHTADDGSPEDLERILTHIKCPSSFVDPPFLHWDIKEVANFFCRYLQPALHLRGMQHFAVFNFILVDESCITGDDPDDWNCKICSIAPDFSDMARTDFEDLRAEDIKPTLKVSKLGRPEELFSELNNIEELLSTPTECFEKRPYRVSILPRAFHELAGYDPVDGALMYKRVTPGEAIDNRLAGLRAAAGRNACAAVKFEDALSRDLSKMLILQGNNSSDVDTD